MHNDTAFAFRNEEDMSSSEYEAAFDPGQAMSTASDRASEYRQMASDSALQDDPSYRPREWTNNMAATSESYAYVVMGDEARARGYDSPPAQGASSGLPSYTGHEEAPLFTQHNTLDMFIEPGPSTMPFLNSPPGAGITSDSYLNGQHWHQATDSGPATSDLRGIGDDRDADCEQVRPEYNVGECTCPWGTDFDGHELWCPSRFQHGYTPQSSVPDRPQEPSVWQFRDLTLTPNSPVGPASELGELTNLQGMTQLKYSDEPVRAWAAIQQHSCYHASGDASSNFFEVNGNETSHPIPQIMFDSQMTEKPDQAIEDTPSIQRSGSVASSMSVYSEVNPGQGPYRTVEDDDHVDILNIEGEGATRTSNPNLTVPNAYEYTRSLSPTPSMLSITPSDCAQELSCPHNDCPAVFTGSHRQGSLNRHLRHVHNHGAGRRVWRCEHPHCPKTFYRSDARLKHYRKYHAHLAPKTIVLRPNQQGRRRGGAGKAWSH